VHQVRRKCRQCCPYLNKIVHTFMPIGTLFTYTVYHCFSSVDNIVHTLVKLSTLSGEEFIVHIKHCLRIWQKVWTKLSTPLSNCPYFLGMNFTVHLKNVHIKHCSRDCLIFKRASMIYTVHLLCTFASFFPAPTVGFSCWHTWNPWFF
jgi:hypothetical protein